MTHKIKPDWAGGDLLSQFVNLLIQTPPIYRIMKQQARRVLVQTAEKNGIPWRETYQAWDDSPAKTEIQGIIDDEVTYPDYYQVPFHAYDDGNLCWPAAFEAESATYSMALRVWPEEDLTWKVAQDRLRSSFHQVLGEYGPQSVQSVLDMGCSVGISTLALHRYYQTQQAHPIRTVGLDLSPHMLTVAKMRDERQEISEWRHARAEASGFPDRSFDLVTLQFVIHELPRQATQEIFREINRILRPGGCLALVDNNPQSPVIQNLPPVLFTLMKSTEPWSDDYYTFDVEAAMAGAGFQHQATVATDPRHRTLVGVKPSA